MRTTKAIRSKLEKAAQANGRSLAQEVEFRLETSFQNDEIERVHNDCLHLMGMIDAVGRKLEITDEEWEECRVT